MADRKLKIDIRRDKILSALRQNGRVSVAELSALLGATEVTIRNDLTALEQDGCLLRVQGGAVPLPDRAAAPADPAIPCAPEKQAIAEAVAARICDGATLFINSGTTSLCVARALKQKRNLNIVTNSLAVAMELGSAATFRVLLLGGVINAQYGFTYGGDTQEQLSQFQADWAILSVDGISANGITTYHAEEAVLDRMMMDGARHTLIAADHTKIGKAGFSRVRDCTGTMTLVTDCQTAALTDLPIPVIVP